MTQLTYIKRRNVTMGIGKLIVYGLALFGAYTIYSAVAPENKPKESTTIEAPASGIEDKTSGTKNYVRGKDFGEGICDFVEGLGGSIVDRVKSTTKEYKQPWEEVKRDTEQYAKELDKLKTNYLDSIVK